MRLATQRKLSYFLLLIGLAALLYSFLHNHYDRTVSELYTEHYGDKLERSLRKAAGPEAFNCGRVPVPRGQLLENGCAPAADAQQHNFYASYRVETMAGVEYRGIARDTGGRYAEFRWKPGEDTMAIYLGPDPWPIPCTTTFRTTWQGVGTCTDEH